MDMEKIVMRARAVAVQQYADAVGWHKARVLVVCVRPDEYVRDCLRVADRMGFDAQRHKSDNTVTITDTDLMSWSEIRFVSRPAIGAQELSIAILGDDTRMSWEETGALLSRVGRYPANMIPPIGIELVEVVGLT